MTGSFVFVVLCLAVAAAAMSPLWLGRRPEEGWLRWFADSFDAFRVRDTAGETAVDASLEELLRDPDNQSLPGYTTPDELRGLFAEARVRR